MKTKYFLVLLGAVLMALGTFQAVFADQFWIIIHHEDQGTPGDKRFEKCMPEDAWNGHDDHTGDWRSEEVYTDNKCENVYVPPVYGCTDPDFDNYNPDATVDDGSCANEPPVCVPEDYNGEEPGCGTPPTEPPTEVPPTEPSPTLPPTEPSPTLPPTEEPTSTPVPPVVVVTPFVPRDVPTCEEMSKMDPDYFATWWSSHWEKLDCPAKGYQTGSGSDFNWAPLMITSGAALLLLAAFLKKKEVAPIA